MLKILGRLKDEPPDHPFTIETWTRSFHTEAIMVLTDDVVTIAGAMNGASEKRVHVKIEAITAIIE